MTAARFSPRDEVVAVLGTTRVGVYALEARGARLALSPAVERDSFDLGWHERGLDLGVCAHGGRARWHYLRQGPRAAEDPPPDAKTWPCNRPRASEPARLTQLDDYGDLVAEGRNLGPRTFQNGWRLGDGKLVTADLVVFDPQSSGARRLLSFRGRTEGGALEKPGLGESAAAVVRTGPDEVVWQVGAQIRIYRADGTRTRVIDDAHLLAPCPDGRLLAWRKRDAATWELFAARHDAAAARLHPHAARVRAPHPPPQLLQPVPISALASEVISTHLGGASPASLWWFHQNHRCACDALVSSHFRDPHVVYAALVGTILQNRRVSILRGSGDPPPRGVILAAAATRA